LLPLRLIMVQRMAASPPDRIAASASFTKARQLAVKITALVVLALLLGFVQDWMTSRYYEPERVAGFHLGVIHGALMPAALPTLLMGKDVAIYAPANEGRSYKIGYILGINLCGTLFFGFAFWRPRSRESVKCPVRSAE
jgi:hypothetical protein